jgi:tellurite resistance protein TerC
MPGSEPMKERKYRITTLQQAKRVIKVVVGFTVVVIGIAGLFLPVLQGVMIIIVGLAILGTEFVWARKLMKRFESGANNLKNSIFNNSK